MSVEFQTGWCATDLGDYRPCAGTYERYSYDSIPVLDQARFTGMFDWVDELGEIDPDAVAKMEELNRQLAEVGLALPRDFVTFQTHTELSEILDAVSVTACWSSVSEKPIPSPVEPGAFLIRFLTDQQDCVMWYLYLRPSGETFVVHSYYSLEDLPSGEKAAAKIFRCAPSFEQFAYRFWIENRLWSALNESRNEPLPPELESYIAHYRRSGEPRSS
jgi:hypothetical protein